MYFCFFKAILKYVNKIILELLCYQHNNGSGLNWTHKYDLYTARICEAEKIMPSLENQELVTPFDAVKPPIRNF